jgi:ribosomal-protein-alanine N-acetyltransferase
MNVLAAPAFRLRPFQAADLSHLAEIDRACFPPQIASSEADFASTLRAPRTVAIVAEADPAGVAGFVLGAASGPVAHVITIDVLPAFRRQGIGTLLLSALEDRLRQSGAIRLILEVAVENVPARRLYEKLRYQQTRMLPEYYPDGSAAWRMEKICEAERALPKHKDPP